jgi:hypothetical protein
MDEGDSDEDKSASGSNEIEKIEKEKDLIKKSDGEEDENNSEGSKGFEDMEEEEEEDEEANEAEAAA